MNRPVLFPIAALVVLVTACSTVSTSYDFDKDADFLSYRTYEWLARPPAPVGDARDAIERNPLLDKRIKAAVNRQLDAKGLKLEPGNPDLLLTYHTGVEDKVHVTDWGYRYGGRYQGRGARDITVTQYQEGTLILDLIDARSKELVFRCSARAVLDPSPTPQQAEAEINEAVAKMLESYPPKAGST